MRDEIKSKLVVNRMKFIVVILCVLAVCLAQDIEPYLLEDLVEDVDIKYVRRNIPNWCTWCVYCCRTLLYSAEEQCEAYQINLC